VKASAEVQASGDASVLPHYRIGFIRTIGQEDATVEYVNGMTLRRSLPTPLRDASEGDPAPWFDFAASQVPAGSGDTTRIQTDAAPNPPRLEFPFAFLTSPILANRAPEKDGRRAAQDQPGRLPIDPVAENVVRRVTRRTEYLLWVAARRDDAPLDRFHTRFLDTNTMTVTQAVDVGVVGGGNVRFEGDARVHGVNSGPGQEPFAQLDGAGPAAFAGANGSGFGLGDRRVVSRGMPTPREQSPDGLDSRAYRARVNEIVTPLRQELGLTQELAMHIALDPKSGRMLVPGIAQRTGNAGNTSVLPSVPGLGLGDREAVMSLPVHVIVALNGAEPGPVAARFALDALAQRFYLRTRGELVLSTPLQAIEVTLPALPGTPRTFPHLHEVPGALAIFREVWREFAKDCRLERSATIIVDRRNGALRRVLRVGQPMKRSGNQVVHSVPACIQPSEGGENRLDVHETVLGVVHTHPDGIAPSLNDAELLKEMHGLGPTGGVNTPEVTAQVRQRLCGNELYTLLRDAHGDVVALNLHPDLPRSKELGPILGDIEGC
jgi:hypothetical protein